MKKVFEIEEDETIIQIAWLSSVSYKKGTGMVELEFSPKLKPYMLKLNSMFTQYKLSNILSLKSKYSPRIYEILKANEFKKQGNVEIEVEDLRRLLKADNIYPRYYDFRIKIIEQVQKELRKLTDIDFEFEEIKTGRKVTSLRFYIKTNKPKVSSIPLLSPNNADNEVCATIEYKNTNEEENHSTGLINDIKAIFKENIDGLEAQKILTAAKGDLKFIKEKYEIAKVTPKITNLVGWVIEAIKRDYQPPKGKVKNGSFNDYEQRTYDFDALEKKLLGWED